MKDSTVYIIIALLALAVVGWILIKRKKRHRNLSSIATTAILLNIAGIVVGETKILNFAFGYGLISVGLILSIIGIITGGKK
jgi:LPXTG-motif cell wall-anchored protein